ncbi:MAG: DMT family transporter [Chloroflexota bacterium]
MPGLVEAAVATLFFASAAILVRGADGVPPAAIAFFRMFLASLVMLAFAAVRRAPLLPPPGRRSRFLLYGLVTAGHFIFYIASLGLTTIAHALVLVNLAPLFTAALGAALLRERPSPRQYPGMVIALVGVAVLAGFEPRLSGRMLLGDLFALISGALYGVYSVIGRSERERLPLPTYALAVYATAAVWLWPLAGFPTALPGGSARLSLALLALLPTCFGHTLYNAALRKGQAAYVNLIATQEATGGIILGALLLREYPSPLSLTGALIAIAGIAWTTIVSRPARGDGAA